MDTRQAPTEKHSEGGQLELLSETLRLPGDAIECFTPHGLLFARNASEGDLLAIGRRLIAVRSYAKWALGSLFAAMISKREERRAVSDRTKKDETPGGAWAGEFAAAHEIDPKEYREMVGVITFYGVGEKGGVDALKDIRGLQFEHYRDAMWGVADNKPRQRERAIELLRVASEQRMTVTQLRRFIRTQTATETGEEKQAELTQYGAVFDFMRWAKRELDKVETYTPERAAIILEDLGDSTLSYIDALRDIARGADPRRIAEARKSKAKAASEPSSVQTNTPHRAKESFANRQHQ